MATEGAAEKAATAVAWQTRQIDWKFDSFVQHGVEDGVWLNARNFGCCCYCNLLIAAAAASSADYVPFSMFYLKILNGQLMNTAVCVSVQTMRTAKTWMSCSTHSHFNEAHREKHTHVLHTVHDTSILR